MQMDGYTMKLKVTFHKFSKVPRKFSYTEVTLNLEAIHSSIRRNI